MVLLFFDLKFKKKLALVLSGLSIQLFKIFKKKLALACLVWVKHSIIQDLKKLALVLSGLSIQLFYTV